MNHPNEGVERRMNYKSQIALWDKNIFRHIRTGEPGILSDTKKAVFTEQFQLLGDTLLSKEHRTMTAAL
jgi:hypothetical protein